MKNDCSTRSISQHQMPKLHRSLCPSMADQNLGVGENLYDGDVSSFWHTAPTAKASHPHQIIIDMQEIYKVTAFRVKVREGSFLSGKVKEFQLYTRPQFFLFH